MDDKVYNLMEKMYIEFSDFKNEMTEFKNDMTQFKKETHSNFIRIERNQVKLENDLSEKFGILSDAQKMTNERLDKLDAKVDALIEQVGVHEVQIKLLKKVVE